MKVNKGLRYAGVMALAAAGWSQTALAEVEESPKVPQAQRDLVMQCHDKAMASQDGDEFESTKLLMDQQNAGDYEKGEELLLHINLLGHGTTIYNISCNVDKQGNVTYEEFQKAGTPAGSTR